MIIHISEERFERIKSQSYMLRSNVTPAINGKIEGDNTLHFLDGEQGFCESCNGTFDSIKANTPAEYETEKEVLRRKAA